MFDVALALEELRDDLNGTQRVISVLQQIGRALTAIVDRGGGAGADSLIRRHLDEIALRMAMALTRHTSIARMPRRAPVRASRTPEESKEGLRDAVVSDSASVAG